MRHAPPFLLSLLALGVALPVAGQRTYAAEAIFQGYSFDEALGASAANLMMFPLAIRQPLGDRLTLDLSGAYAFGKIERGGQVYELTGPVDTRVHLSFLATPWAELTVSATVPTGVATHDDEEALVASVLATDLLGFREATWGQGFGVTTGIATAARIAGFGVGLGAAYRVSGEFEPSATEQFSYRPGDELRVRLGLDRTVGPSGTFTAGATYQSFAEDQRDGRNLFQAGERISFDASYQFRLGREVWSIYGADVWREHGSTTLDVLDQSETVVGDTTFATPSQNLIVLGVTGGVPLGGLRIRPTADIRLQDRKVADSDVGSGWMGGFGFDIPLRVAGSLGVFPRARYSRGSIVAPDGEWRDVWGGEVGLIVSLSR